MRILLLILLVSCGKQTTDIKRTPTSDVQEFCYDGVAYIKVGSLGLSVKYDRDGKVSIYCKE